MTHKPLLVLAALLLLSLLLPAAWAGRAAPAAIEPNATLRADDGDARHYFGSDIALQGDVAIIGAPGWNNEHGDYTGAAYVFQYQGGGWVQQETLLAPDARRNSTFGNRVELDGTTLLIGSPNRTRGQFGDPDFAQYAGALYVYSGSGADWTYQTRLMPAELEEGASFGGAVALEGDTLLVGTPYYGFDGPESVFAYQRVGDNWGAPQIIGRPGGAPHYFGAAVAVAGNVALVGAPGISCCDASSLTEKGAVYVFSRIGNDWLPAGTIRATDGFNGDNFGCNVRFDGTTAVIAACQAYGLPQSYSYAYVYTRDGANFTQTARLEPEGDTAFPNGVGEIGSIELSGNTLLLGTTSAAPAPWAGRFYLYRREAGVWTLQEPIAAPGGQPDTGFGGAMALNARHFLAGAATLPDLNVEEQGGVFAYDTLLAFDYHAFAPVVQAPGD